MLTLVHLSIGNVAGQFGDPLQFRRRLGQLGRLAQGFLIVLILTLKLLRAVERVGGQRLLPAQLLLHPFNVAFLLLEGFADRFQSAIDLVTLGKDLLLLKRVALPHDPQRQPLIGWVKNDVRPLVFLGQIVAHTKAIGKVVVFLDLADQFQDVTGYDRRDAGPTIRSDRRDAGSTSARKLQRLTYRFAIVDTILQLDASHADVIRCFDFEGKALVGQHATRFRLPGKSLHRRRLIDLNVNRPAR